MPYFLGRHPNPNYPEVGSVWEIDDKVARHVASGTVQTEAVLSPPPNVKLEHHPNWTFIPLKLIPGEYYPRMARPSARYPTQGPGFCPDTSPSLLEAGRGQLLVLSEQLERIFRTVQPVPKNFGTYGHDIRNLLILAATEVEAHCKGVLIANEARGRSTEDYVKLLPAMKLDEYDIEMPYYPWVGPFNPFRGWVAKPSTQSLTWYDAYNAVKHDRETAFERATLENALKAVCAVAIMLVAQFGREAFRNRPGISSFFQLATIPRWDVSEVYADPLPGTTRVPKNYSF
jgi:hypothetical protein